MTAIVNRTFRKSPIAYVGVVLSTTILVLLLSIPVSLTSGGVRSFFQLLAFLVVVRGIYRLIYLFTVRWVVSPQGLVVSQGILPWRKSSRLAPWETIFEAFYTRSFLGHFLNYGQVSVRRAEGVTSSWQENRMQRCNELTGLVNSHLAEVRALLRPTAAPAPAGPVMAPSPGGLDSLSDLAKLKASGDITLEEYERLKARIIGL